MGLMVDTGSTDYLDMHPPQIAKLLARIIGAGLISLGLAGFYPNSYIGLNGIIPSDMFLNCLHVGLGMILLAFTGKGEGTAATGLYTVAMLAAALAMIGFVGIEESANGQSSLFNTMLFSEMNVYLAAGIAVVSVVCASMNTSSRQLIRD